MIKKILVPLLCLSSINVSFAQENFDDIDDEFGDYYSAADFISIATGTKTSIDKAPAIASVITADDMRKRGVRNLTEALAIIPGLNVSRSSQLMAPKFNFRGITSTFSPQTLLMINGTPLTSGVRGDSHTVWGEFPIHGIERIEVIRGPGSALYGADAFSGVINIITKGASEISHNTVGGGVGSFGSENVWFNSALSGQHFDLGISAEYSKSDGHKELISVDAQSNLDVLASDLFGLSPVSYAPGGVNVGFEVLDVFVKANIYDFQFNLSIQERSNVGTGQGVGEALDPHGKVAGRKFIFDAKHETEEFQSGWKLNSKFSYYRSSQEIEKDLIIFPAGKFFGDFPNGVIGNPEWDEDNISFNVKADNTSLDGHFISIGMGFSKTDLYEVKESKNFFSDFSPRPNGTEDVSDTSEVFMPEASRNNSFVYIQDIWQFSPDWELTAGFRWDDYSDFGSTLNPRLALVWSTSVSSTTKFLYGRAFRAPSFAELLVTNNPVALGNPDLLPEIIDTYEVGYSVRINSSTTLNINAFYYQIDDFITFTPDEFSSSSTAQNVGERDGLGLEIESSIKITKNIDLKTNYSYVKARDKLLSDDVGDYPNHQLNTILNWSVDDYWGADLVVNVVGNRSRVPIDSRSSLGGYCNLSVNLYYTDTNNGFEVALSGKNILNDSIYEPSTGPSTSGGAVNIPFDLPQAGGAFYFSISKTF